MRKLAAAWEDLQIKKKKLKGTAYYCNQEMKKMKFQLKDQITQLKEFKEDKNELQISLQEATDKISIYEEKIDAFKRQEMDISLSRSVRSVTSEDMNSKLIEQNR